MGLQPNLALAIRRIVEERTQQRLQDLSVEVARDTIVLRGLATTFHVKQLAQHGILDKFPGTRVLNAIEVASRN